MLFNIILYRFMFLVIIMIIVFFVKVLDYYILGEKYNIFVMWGCCNLVILYMNGDVSIVRDVI